MADLADERGVAAAAVPSAASEPLAPAPDTTLPSGAVEVIPKRKGNLFVPGHPRYGGRKKGQANRKTKRAIEMADAMGVDPVKFLLEVIAKDMVQEPVRGPNGQLVLGTDGKPQLEWVCVSLETKIDAAKAVAPYIHPKLVSKEVTGADGGPIESVHVEMDIASILASPEGIEAAQQLALSLAAARADRLIDGPDGEEE